MAKLLKEIGYSFNSPEELDIVRDIKEKTCFVALDYDMAMNEDIEASRY